MVPDPDGPGKPPPGRNRYCAPRRGCSPISAFGETNLYELIHRAGEACGDVGAAQAGCLPTAIAKVVRNHPCQLRRNVDIFGSSFSDLSKLTSDGATYSDTSRRTRRLGDGQRTHLSRFTPERNPDVIGVWRSLRLKIMQLDEARASHH